MMQAFWAEIFRIQEQIPEHGLGESVLVQAAPPVRNRVKRTIQAAYLFFRLNYLIRIGIKSGENVVPDH